MRHVLSFILALLLGVSALTAEEFTTGGVYVPAATTNLSYTLIGKTTNLVQSLQIGQTYRLETNAMEFKTEGGQTVRLSLSTGLQAAIAPNSTFSVDGFNQMVSNYESLPAVLKADAAMTSLSLLDGEVTLICPKLDQNSQSILQTPLVNVSLGVGKLVVRANPKYVILNAIEGSVEVVDAKNKKNIIDKGNLGLIIPYPGRDGEIMVTQKPIAGEDLQKMTKILAELEQQAKEVLFVVIDKKVVGIRLK